MINASIWEFNKYGLQKDADQAQKCKLCQEVFETWNMGEAGLSRRVKGRK